MNNRERVELAIELAQIDYYGAMELLGINRYYVMTEEWKLLQDPEIAKQSEELARLLGWKDQAE